MFQYFSVVRVKAIDHSMYVFFVPSWRHPCNQRGAFWAQMCPTARTQWTAPLISMSIKYSYPITITDMLISCYIKSTMSTLRWPSCGPTSHTQAHNWANIGPTYCFLCDISVLFSHAWYGLLRVTRELAINIRNRCLYHRSHICLFL